MKGRQRRRETAMRTRATPARCNTLRGSRPGWRGAISATLSAAVTLLTHHKHTDKHIGSNTVSLGCWRKQMWNGTVGRLAVVGAGADLHACHSGCFCSSQHGHKIDFLKWKIDSTPCTSVRNVFDYIGCIKDDEKKQITPVGGDCTGCISKGSTVSCLVLTPL